MNTFINYYEILHVSQDAPVEIIRLAYKGLAQKYHPDRYQGNDANEKMQLI
ncbi:J domain-containing protein, partial [Acinetobacter baumannii]